MPIILIIVVVIISLRAAVDAGFNIGAFASAALWITLALALVAAAKIALLAKCHPSPQTPGSTPQENPSDLLKKAKSGDACAQNTLGFMYAQGHGVERDNSEALKWYGKAAEQGLAEAQCRLGVMYGKGTGVTQNHAEAVKWYRSAAEQGYAEAQYHLGFMYAKGLGIAQDHAEAAKWYLKAAEQGSPDAQLDLGCLYAGWQGARQNDVLAHMWYGIAAANGSQYATRQLEEVAGRLSSTQITEARKQTREWLDGHPLALPNASLVNPSQTSQSGSGGKQPETAVEWTNWFLNGLLILLCGGLLLTLGGIVAIPLLVIALIFLAPALSGLCFAVMGMGFATIILWGLLSVIFQVVFH